MGQYVASENYRKGSISTAITDTTSTECIATPGTGRYLFITDILVTNSHASQGTVVQILSGSTIIWIGYAKAEGGFSLQLGVPLACGANEALNVKPVTTGASIYASASGYVG